MTQCQILSAKKISKIGKSNKILKNKPHKLIYKIKELYFADHQLKFEMNYMKNSKFVTEIILSRVIIKR